MMMRIAIVLCCFMLSACPQPMKVAYNWEDFEKVRATDSELVSTGFDSAWSAAQQAGSELQMTPVAEDRNSGVLTFVKKDEKFGNASHQLTVRITPDDAYRTRVWLRAFMFTKFGERASNVFPSDGTLENEFFDLMQQKI